MENINEETPQVSQEQIQKAHQEAVASSGMILKWAEHNGRLIIKQMEIKKHPLTVGIAWFQVRKGWLGGFMSGVQAGFQLGYKTAHKLSEGFVNGIDAVVQGTEAEAIVRRNEELKTLLGEAVGEASMCWETPEKAGIFDSTKAEVIIARLYERFSTPVPPTPKAPSLTVAPGPKQERLPGL